jgi:hypothetical protein
MLLMAAIGLLSGTILGLLLAWRAVQHAVPRLLENAKAWAALEHSLAQLPPDAPVPQLPIRHPLLAHRTIKVVLGIDPILVPALALLGSADLIAGYSLAGALLLATLAVFALAQPICIRVAESLVRRQTHAIQRLSSAIEWLYAHHSQSPSAS